MKIIESSNAAKTSLLKPVKKYNNKLCIRTQYANLIIDKSDISYLKSDSNYCLIYLLDGSHTICSKTLKEVNLRIANPKFIRVHKSYVVNINEIVSLNPNYSEITLRDGSKIPISRSRRSEVKEVVKYMFD